MITGLDHLRFQLKLDQLDPVAVDYLINVNLQICNIETAVNVIQYIMPEIGGKLGTFLQKNVVFITGIGITVSTHWGWSQLQKNPKLVPEDKRKDLPIIIGYRHVKDKISEYFNQLSK